jgi:hypothetical protein
MARRNWIWIPAIIGLVLLWALIAGPLRSGCTVSWQTSSDPRADGAQVAFTGLGAGQACDGLSARMPAEMRNSRRDLPIQGEWTPVCANETPDGRLRVIARVAPISTNQQQVEAAQAWARDACQQM